MSIEKNQVYEPLVLIRPVYIGDRVRTSVELRIGSGSSKILPKGTVGIVTRGAARPLEVVRVLFDENETVVNQTSLERLVPEQCDEARGPGGI